MSLKPKIITPDEAARLIFSGATVMFGGFLGCGCAHDTIDAMLCLPELGRICGIMDDASLVKSPDGSDYYGYAKLIHSGQMTSCITGHLGTNPDAEGKAMRGELRAELVPEGSLAEMIRAGGCGLGGVITPTGVGTLIEQSPLVETKMNISGREYLVMKPLRADFALISGSIVDTMGNVWYRGTTRAFSPLMAMAADTVIVEAEEIVEPGTIEPENVHTPGLLVDYIVRGRRRDG